MPGVRKAEGKEKGKGVIVRRGPKEAQSEDAGRRTGIGYAVWYTRDERARNREVLPPRWGVLITPARISAVAARNGASKVSVCPISLNTRLPLYGAEESTEPPGT